MKSIAIVAENAPAALAQIHSQLGPDAVVVSVRKLPASGISRLWKHTGSIEVMAIVPETEPGKHAVPPGEDAYVPFGDKIEMEPVATLVARRWKSITWLESMGLLSAFADELERRLAAEHGENPPPMPVAEWTAVRVALAKFWCPARPTMAGPRRPHVFVGPAGSGKTTALCKWMTAAALREEHKVHVWRLDGENANVGGFSHVAWRNHRCAGGALLERAAGGSGSAVGGFAGRRTGKCPGDAGVARTDFRAAVAARAFGAECGL